MSEVRFTGRVIELTPEEMRQEYDTCLLTLGVLDDTSYDLTTLPGKVFVEPTTDQELCEQIAEPGGLHTCDMTTTVNAFIWQGWLTKLQGDEIHDRFPTHQPDREFTTRVINGKKVLIASREEHVIRAISGENLYSAASLVGEVTQGQVTARILGTLANGVVLNVGNGQHSRLAVGYDATSDRVHLQVADPYRPNDLEMMPIEHVVAFHPSTALFGVAKKSESLNYRPDISF